MILAKIFVYSLGAFYAWLLSIVILFRYVTDPTKKFWSFKRVKTPPKCLSDPVHGKHCYIKLKDVKLHYVENGDNSKPLMLMVHGFPEFWYTWRHQIKEFSKDYWTVAFDMRGYGDSDKPTSVDDYDIGKLTDDIRQIIQGLGRNKCILVAHDWGGVVAWHFVIKHQDMIEKYIIMDAPYFPLYAKVVRKNWKQFFSSWYTFFIQLPYLPELFMKCYDYGLFEVAFYEGKKASESKVTEEDLNAFKYTFGQPGALTPPLNYYRANLWRGKGKRKSGGRGKINMDNMPHGLLIFAENDRYLHRDFVTLTKEHVKNLETHIVPNANHFVQQDQPELVNVAMRNFLKIRT